MKKEELMYGNKLLFLNEVVTFSHISQIREDGVFWIKTIEPKIDSKIFHFKPIPITEEWLEKSGFVIKKGKDYKGKDYTCATLFLNHEFLAVIEWLEKEKVCYLDFESTKNSIDIKYVHQLQNLYFALTGTHLTLK